MFRVFSAVIPARVFPPFSSEIILLFASFIAGAFADPDIDDVGLFLVYDSGAYRIAVVVGFVILGLFFNNLYSEVRIRSRRSLFQSLCMIFGVAFIGQGVIGYLYSGVMLPRKMMLAGTVIAG